MKLLIITITAFLAYSKLDISLKDTGYIANYALPLFTDNICIPSALVGPISLIA